MTYASACSATKKVGLIIMGAFHPRKVYGPDDKVGTLILVGTGSEFWSVFSKGPEYIDGLPDPVDRWSKRVLGQIANQFGAECRFPSDGPPYAPFIDWALKSGRAWQSPTGMLVHDRAGLMISYRGALLFDAEMSIPPAEAPSPCIGCVDKPCTTTCPTGALSAAQAYDVPLCHSYLDTPTGSDCMTLGCAARRACPISATSGRLAAQSALHMKAFHPK